MLLFDLIYCTLLEKIKKFHELFNLRMSIFSIVSINPRISEHQIFYLTNLISIIEMLSGQLPSVKKISFKNSSNDMRIIVKSSNIKSIFIIKFFTFIHAFMYLQSALANLFLKLSVIPLKNKVFVKVQNATVFSNFFGNLEKYSSTNTQLNIYAFIEVSNFDSKYYKFFLV